VSDSEPGLGELGRLGLREPAQRAKLSGQVARQIVNYIVDGGIEPGATLPPERVMLERFGVSRGTLREALRILEVHGVITLKPGPTGGPVVEPMSGRQLGVASTLHYHLAGATFRELWEARVTVEPVMARLAAERPSSQVRERLRHVMDRAQRAPGDHGYVEAASEFHTTLSSMTGNRILDLYAIAFSEIWNANVRELIFPEHERGRVFEDHEAIANAVIAGDGELAERLMREHMSEMMAYVESRYPGILDQVVPFML
jgi:GntR family transcriptional regulator, transcriptional repressor for pyruvate dehydrogenase complex